MGQERGKDLGHSNNYSEIEEQAGRNPEHTETQNKRESHRLFSLRPGCRVRTARRPVGLQLKPLQLLAAKSGNSWVASSGRVCRPPDCLIKDIKGSKQRLQRHRLADLVKRLVWQLGSD
jgi:hypothetical protein